MALDPSLTKFTTASPVLASYSFSDIADGTGVIKLYGAIAGYNVSGSTDTGETFLSQEAVKSSGVAVSNLFAAGTLTGGSYDLDLAPLNITRTAKGTAIITYKQNKGSNHIQCDWKLVKYDGSTETDISSTVKGAYDDADNAIRIPLTETIFAAGDILRLKLTINGTNAGDFVYCDPQGSNGTIELYMPWEIIQ